MSLRQVRLYRSSQDPAYSVAAEQFKATCRQAGGSVGQREWYAGGAMWLSDPECSLPITGGVAKFVFPGDRLGLENEAARVRGGVPVPVMPPAWTDVSTPTPIKSKRAECLGQGGQWREPNEYFPEGNCVMIAGAVPPPPVRPEPAPYTALSRQQTQWQKMVEYGIKRGWLVERECTAAPVPPGLSLHANCSFYRVGRSRQTGKLTPTGQAMNFMQAARYVSTYASRFPTIYRGQYV